MLAPKAVKRTVWGLERTLFVVGRFREGANFEGMSSPDFDHIVRKGGLLLFCQVCAMTGFENVLLGEVGKGHGAGRGVRRYQQRTGIEHRSVAGRISEGSAKRRTRIWRGDRIARPSPSGKKFIGQSSAENMHEMARQYLGRGCALQTAAGVRNGVSRSPIDMRPVSLSRLAIVAVLKGGIKLIALSNVVIHPCPINVPVMNGGNGCDVIVATWSCQRIGIRFGPDRC